MIDDGDVKPDMEDAVKRALLQADKSHGKRADRIIEDFDATRPAVRVHGTVEKAIAAGAFADASSIEQGG